MGKISRFNRYKASALSLGLALAFATPPNQAQTNDASHSDPTPFLENTKSFLKDKAFVMWEGKNIYPKENNISLYKPDGSTVEDLDLQRSKLYFPSEQNLLFLCSEEDDQPICMNRSMFLKNRGLNTSSFCDDLKLKRTAVALEAARDSNRDLCQNDQRLVRILNHSNQSNTCYCMKTSDFTEEKLFTDESYAAWEAQNYISLKNKRLFRDDKVGSEAKGIDNLFFRPDSRLARTNDESAQWYYGTLFKKVNGVLEPFASDRSYFASSAHLDIKDPSVFEQLPVEANPDNVDPLLFGEKLLPGRDLDVYRPDGSPAIGGDLFFKAVASAGKTKE